MSDSRGAKPLQFSFGLSQAKTKMDAFGALLQSAESRPLDQLTPAPSGEDVGEEERKGQDDERAVHVRPVLCGVVLREASNELAADHHALCLADVAARGQHLLTGQPVMLALAQPCSGQRAQVSHMPCRVPVCCLPT
jgi:hypothetical protein